MSAIATVGDAVAFLQKKPSVVGVSVFDHLARVVAEVLKATPDNVVDLLETSLLVKQTSSTPCLHDQSVNVKELSETKEAEQILTLFRPPIISIDPDTGQAIDRVPPAEYECEDMLGASALFEALGVGLGRAEMYRAMLGARALGEDPRTGAAAVRFFGKVLGIRGDYYVFEVTPKDGAGADAATASGPADDVPSEVGTGINAKLYCVCSQPGSPLVRLPDATPARVCEARRIKRFLTGDLSATLSAYPPFPGLEADFLRVQIARIAATTTLCPTGQHVLTDEGIVEKNEEWLPPSCEQYSSPSAWCHSCPHVNAQGRCTFYKPEHLEGEEEELEPSGAEEGPAPLAPLDGDALLAQGGAAWTDLASSRLPGVLHQVSGMRSNVWPGAYAAASGKIVSNIYVGWAIKSAPFMPMPPPLPAQEFAAVPLECTELPLRPELETEVVEGEAGEGQED